MKDQLASILRHALTALAALGTFLATSGWIVAEDEAAINAAGASLIEIVVAVVAAIVARLLIFLVGKMRGSGGGLSIMMIGGCLPLAIVAGSLSSCAEFPVVIGIETEHGRAGYSSKGGLTVDAVIPRSSK